MRLLLNVLILLFAQYSLFAAELRGKVFCADSASKGLVVVLNPGKFLTLSSADGGYYFDNVRPGKYLLSISSPGFVAFRDSIEILEGLNEMHDISLKPLELKLNEIVISASFKESERSESPVPVEIYRAAVLQKNPGSCLFDIASMINGLRPQITCNICQAGDIRINGMEGPYSLILIDGMPIVSGLSSVYGMNGIPAGLLDRLEVVKGPASTLYGSEAMAGLINVVTKKPGNSLKAGLEHFSTSWLEHQSDLWVQLPFLSKHSVATGISHYLYNNKIDNNSDGFMDLPLQQRLSVFNSWRFSIKEARYLQIAARYFSENRGGGQLNWTPEYAGSDSIYGESVSINRWELLASQQLPIKENISWQFSWNHHRQNSFYGLMPFNAEQTVMFGQIYLNHKIGSKHNLLAGAGIRYNDYEDDSPATAGTSYTDVSRRLLPGLFVQNEWQAPSNLKVLAGYRSDYDPVHGIVHSPRLAFHFKRSGGHEWRAGYGTGYRVVNLFTEDHAALSGSRDVVVLENLKPERSWNIHAEHRLELSEEKYGLIINSQLFYTHFSNRIIGDFDTDPQKILFRNLSGFAFTAGGAGNISLNLNENWSFSAGITYNDVMLVSSEAGDVRSGKRQLYSPRWSGVWEAGYTFSTETRVDITSNWYGSMRLPIQKNDFRSEYSPQVHLINLKLSHPVHQKLNLWMGIKNLLNVTGRNPIMRPFDPFDKKAADTIANPRSYTFDTAYNYAPLQGIRFYVGFSLKL